MEHYPSSQRAGLVSTIVLQDHARRSMGRVAARRALQLCHILTKAVSTPVVTRVSLVKGRQGVQMASVTTASLFAVLALIGVCWFFTIGLGSDVASVKMDRPPVEDAGAVGGAHNSPLPIRVVVPVADIDRSGVESLTRSSDALPILGVDPQPSTAPDSKGASAPWRVDAAALLVERGLDARRAEKFIERISDGARYDVMQTIVLECLMQLRANTSCGHVTCVVTPKAERSGPTWIMVYEHDKAGALVIARGAWDDVRLDICINSGGIRQRLLERLNRQ